MDAASSDFVPTIDSIRRTFQTLQLPEWGDQCETQLFDACTRKACATSAASALYVASRQLADRVLQDTACAASRHMAKARRKYEEQVRAATASHTAEYARVADTYKATVAAVNASYEAELLANAALQNTTTHCHEAAGELQRKLASRLSSAEEDPPDEAAALRREMRVIFLCPITRQRMTDPVITPEGISYERSAIERWLLSKTTDPVTRSPLFVSQLTDNRALKDVLDRCPSPASAATDMAADDDGGRNGDDDARRTMLLQYVGP